MVSRCYSGAVDDLYVIVERLSMLDRQRIVRLIEVLRRAPEGLRELTQFQLCELTVSEPGSHAECVSRIDAIIAHAENALESRNRGRVADARSRDEQDGARWA